MPIKSNDEYFKVSVDTGASGTKISYWDEDGNLKCILVSPYCAEVSASTIATKSRMLDEDAIPHVESSWVTIADKSCLLGLSAQKYFGSEVLDSERKFEKSLYKILGILAHVTYIEDELRPIDLGILLPFDEYSTKFELEKRLRQAVEDTKKKFSYCDRPQALQLKSIKIRPEGSGIYLKGLKDLTDISKPVASLVIGHRNASHLVAINGAPQEELCDTCDLGFRWLVNRVRQLTGYKGDLDVAQTIASGNMPDDMRQALDQALPEYWEMLQSWLMSQSLVTHTVASGGGAIFLKPYIQKLYGASKVSWADSLAKEIYAQGLTDKSLVRRFTDCYGLLLSLEAKVKVAS